MLLFRSIILEILLVLLVTQSIAQEYEGDDHEEVSTYDESGEYHGHPDYSKYYSVDSSSPLTAATSGFVGELSGFTPIAFSGSSKASVNLPPITFVPQKQQSQSLPIFAQTGEQFSPYNSGGLRDFFEESQRKEKQTEEQKINEDFIQPGPHYISHQVPYLKLRINNEDEVKAASRDDVERIPPRPNKPKKDDDIESDDKDYKLPDFDYSPVLTNSKAPVDYNIGKSGSSVSQYPLAAGYLKAASEKLTPYQKYSFQPATEGINVQSSGLQSALLSTLPPFNPAYGKTAEPIATGASEDSPASLKGCRKLVRPASDGVETMNCFVCENEESKSKYTQCSYAAEKEPVGYYTSNSERYSLPSEESLSSRFKRYTNKHDPYYSVRERSRKAFEEPSIPKGYDHGFYYDPEFDGSSSELSYSEKQTAELKKNPENCKKVEDKGMLCTICKDPKTGGNYEQCSYSSEPSEKKYAYVTQKKYDSEDEPEETKVSVSKTPPSKNVSSGQQRADESEIKPVVKDTEHIEAYQGRIPQTKYPRKRRQNEEEEEDKREYNDEESSAEDTKPNKKQNVEDDFQYDVPYHFAETVKQSSRLGHQDDEAEKEEDKEASADESSDFDEYHFKLFPELKKNKQVNADENEEEDFHIPAATKQNVEEVLAEFSKKDRSTCKRSEKNGMTCFLCVDKNNIQHEECMYVQESRPKSSHVAYHAAKAIKPTKAPQEDSEEESQNDETKSQPIVVPTNEKSFLAQAPNDARTKRSAETGKGEETQEAEKEEKEEDNEETKKESEAANEEPTLKTPTEFEVGDEEGAFSAETKPVYSRTHGMELPRYMVERTEFEKEFDYSASSF